MDIRSQGLYLGLLSVTLISMSGTSHAVSVSSDQRQLNINGEVSSYNQRNSWNEQAFADANEAIFNKSLSQTETLNANTSTSNASISSSITSTNNQTVFAGNGNAYSYVSSVHETNPRFRHQRANSFSEYEITFTLTEAASFDLIGSLFYDETTAGNRYGGAVFSLTNNDYNAPGFSLVLGNSYSNNNFNQAIQLSGVLDPGSYRLEAYAKSNISTYNYGYGPDTSEINAGYDFNFTLNQGLNNTPPQVPVPAAAWLFGSALLSLVNIQRMKKITD